MRYVKGSVVMALLAGLTALALGAGAVAAETCPEQGKVEGGNLNGIVLEAGTLVCIKGADTLVEVVADGTSTLQQLLGATNQNGQLQDVSHYTVLSQPTTTTTTTSTTTTTLPGQVTVQIEGYCVVDQDGVGLAYMDFAPTQAAIFTINGVVYDGPPSFGINAQFGVNTWSAVARDGFTLTGETSGTFTIDECGVPGTTTTTVPTTTTDPTTSTPDATLTIPPDQGTPGTSGTPTTARTATAETLPFTGPGTLGPLALVAGSLLTLGATLVAGFRRRDDE